MWDVKKENENKKYRGGRGSSIQWWQRSYQNRWLLKKPSCTLARFLLGCETKRTRIRKVRDGGYYIITAKILSEQTIVDETFFTYSAQASAWRKPSCLFLEKLAQGRTVDPHGSTLFKKNLLNCYGNPFLQRHCGRERSHYTRSPKGLYRELIISSFRIEFSILTAAYQQRCEVDVGQYSHPAIKFDSWWGSQTISSVFGNRGASSPGEAARNPYLAEIWDAKLVRKNRVCIRDVAKSSLPCAIDTVLWFFDSTVITNGSNMENMTTIAENFLWQLGIPNEWDVLST